jgi:hypothetical protein
MRAAISSGGPCDQSIFRSDFSQVYMQFAAFANVSVGLAEAPVGEQFNQIVVR